MIDKIRSLFSNSDIEEHWETDKHGVNPEYPLIFFGSGSPVEVSVESDHKSFYNEFLGVVGHYDDCYAIDVNGRLFSFQWHSNKFYYTAFTGRILKVNDINSILIQMGINFTNDFDSIKSISNLLAELSKKPNWIGIDKIAIEKW